MKSTNPVSKQASNKHFQKVDDGHNTLKDANQKIDDMRVQINKDL